MQRVVGRFRGSMRKAVLEIAIQCEQKANKELIHLNLDSVGVHVWNAYGDVTKNSRYC